jgi:hypothetical protein
LPKDCPDSKTTILDDAVKLSDDSFNVPGNACC